MFRRQKATPRSVVSIDQRNPRRLRDELRRRFLVSGKVLCVHESILELICDQPADPDVCTPQRWPSAEPDEQMPLPISPYWRDQFDQRALQRRQRVDRSKSLDDSKG
jgi:hypothetical protein